MMLPAHEFRREKAYWSIDGGRVALGADGAPQRGCQRDRIGWQLFDRFRQPAPQNRGCHQPNADLSKGVIEQEMRRQREKMKRRESTDPADTETVVQRPKLCAHLDFMNKARVCSPTRCTWRRVSAPATSPCCADHMKRSMPRSSTPVCVPRDPFLDATDRPGETAGLRRGFPRCTVKRPERDGRCNLSSTSVPLSMRST